MAVMIERTEIAYKGWLQIIMAHMRGDDGKQFRRLVEDHGNGVAVLPYCPEKRTALIIRLPRAPVLYSGQTEHLIEAPAGLQDEGETAEQAVRREAEEEAGLRLSALEPVGRIWTMPGISTEQMALYLAAYAPSDRISAGGGLDEENENITVEEMPLAELARLADANQLTDMRTLVLLQTLRIRHPDLFA